MRRAGGSRRWLREARLHGRLHATSGAATDQAQLPLPLLLPSHLVAAGCQQLLHQLRACWHWRGDAVVSPAVCVRPGVRVSPAAGLRHSTPHLGPLLSARCASCQRARAFAADARHSGYTPCGHSQPMSEQTHKLSPIYSIQPGGMPAANLQPLPCLFHVSGPGPRTPDQTRAHLTHTAPGEAIMKLPRRAGGRRAPHVPKRTTAIWPLTAARASRTTKSMFGMPMRVVMMDTGTPSYSPAGRDTRNDPAAQHSPRPVVSCLAHAGRTVAARAGSRCAHGRSLGPCTHCCRGS